MSHDSLLQQTPRDTLPWYHGRQSSLAWLAQTYFISYCVTSQSRLIWAFSCN
jgi:hypothetical protein